MTIAFTCPHCKSAFRVKDEAAGTWGTCPACKKPALVIAMQPPVLEVVETVKPEPPRPAYQQPYQQVPHQQQYQRSPQSSNRVAAGVLAILLGNLGIHKFIMGYPGEGVVMLLVTLVCLFSSCFLFGIPLIGCLAISVIALVEGIVYLTKSDEEFHRIYVVGRRPWF